MKMKYALPIAIAFASMTLAGCGQQVVTEIVTETKVETIVFNVSGNINLFAGDSYQLDYKVTGTDKSPFFSSTNSSVAEVSDTGLITAKKAGQAVITIAIANVPNSSTEVKVTVTKKAPIMYGKYQIKDGVTDLSFLQGYPWLNTSVVGAIGSIEKPAAKDDFFAYANYDRLKDITIPEGYTKNGGMIYESRVLVDQYLDTIISDENSPFPTLLDYIEEGDKEGIQQEVNSILSLTNADVLKLLNSTEIFDGYSKLLKICRVTGKEGLKLDYNYNGAVPGAGYLAAYSFTSDAIYQGMLTALYKVAAAEGIDDANINAKIKTAFDVYRNLYAAAYYANQETLSVDIDELDQVFTGKINVEKLLKEMGVKANTSVAYSNFIRTYILALDNLSYDELRYALALNKIVDYRFFIGIEDYMTLSKDIKAINGYKEEGIVFDDDFTVEKAKKEILANEFPEMINREYVDRYVTDTSREKVKQLIDDVIDGYKDMLSGNKWLSKSTVNKAIEKLEAMNYTPFYDSEYVEIDPCSFSENYTLLDAKDAYEDYCACGLATENICNDILHDDFYAFTINAAYYAIDNNFAICHGIISSFIDKENVSIEQLYGSIGVAIGHEISHGFDDSGAKYDKDGNYSDWWTSTDKAKFEEKVKKIVDYYDNTLVAFPDEKLQGEKMTGEIIADMGGMRVMLGLAEKIDNFNYEEFFESFAYFFGYAYRPEIARLALSDDPHPLSYLRCNVTCAQFDKFQETYDVKEDDLMYIKPADRISVW